MKHVILLLLFSFFVSKSLANRVETKNESIALLAGAIEALLVINPEANVESKDAVFKELVKHQITTIQTLENLQNEYQGQLIIIVSREGVSILVVRPENVERGFAEIGFWRKFHAVGKK
jgi:hypothetical protein